MAKPSFHAAVRNDADRGRHSLLRIAQPGKDPRAVDRQPGQEREDLRDVSRSNSLDGVSDAGPVQRVKRVVHDARAVTDIELRATVRPVVYTPERLLFLMRFIRKAHQPYANTATLSDEALLDLLRIAIPTTFMLGDFGGVVLFCPVTPGHEAALHTYVWNPLYYRRYYLLRAVCRLMFHRLDLHRISTVVAATDRLALRATERTGFQKEGVLREYFRYIEADGSVRTTDATIWSLLRKEV